MITMLDWFSDEPTEEEEIAMAAYSAEHGIPIPQSYKEAVNHPIYGKRWREAIEFEIGQLLANNTWEERIPPPGVNLISSK